MIRRAFVTAVVPLVFLLSAGWAGVDFGAYWDDESMFTKVQRALASPPTLLPFAYDYPSVTFWMALATVAPEAARDPQLRHVIPDTSSLLALTRTETLKLRARRMFLAVSAVALVWTAGLALALGGPPGEAFLAAAILACSWEVGYHVRWIMPDGVMMQFGALAVFAALLSTRAEARATVWLAIAAGAVGLATGSKYSAWPLTVPLAIAALTAPGDTRARVRRAFLALAASVAVFCVTTPGTVLQPTLFMSGIRSQLAHYSTGHSVNTINRGFEHLWRMGEYFTIVLLSPYAPIAFAWSALAVVGAVSLWRQSSRLAAIVLTFPVLYIAYFSLQRVMIVRNLLIVAPFIAWLAARGARVTWDALGRTRAPYAVRFVFATVIAAALGANVVWDVRSVDTIRARSPQRTGHEFAEWLRTRQPGTVWLAPSLSADVRATETAIAAPRERATALAFSASDPLLANVPANRRGLFAAVFGPREVNLDYYPNWIGDEHIVVLSAERARELGIR